MAFVMGYVLAVYSLAGYVIVTELADSFRNYQKQKEA